MIKLKQTISALLALFIGASSAVYAYSCETAYIDNKSKKPWTFQFGEIHNGVQRGNVYFSGAGINCPVNGPCTIMPGTKAMLEYTQTWAESSGDVTITDNKGNVKIFTYMILGHRCPAVNPNILNATDEDDQYIRGSFLIKQDAWVAEEKKG